MDIITIYPLDFEKFAWANNVGAKVIDALRVSFEQKKPVDKFIHERMTALFELYLIVGGMPEAVSTYLETKNLRKVADAQSAIIRLYKRDISKYDEKNRLYLNEIFDLIPSELTAHGYTLYYYNSKKFGELDFVIEEDGRVLPIEIKSGKDYYRHNAMYNVLNVTDYNSLSLRSAVFNTYYAIIK